ncbi:MAG TPA: tyrosine-type recombinase/integrase, partial [Candidatus Binatia bacterium]
MSLPYKRKDSPYWWIAPMVNGLQDPRSSKTRDYQEALRMLRRLEGKVADGEPIANDKILFEELAAKLVQSYRIKGRKTLVDLERRLNKHILPRIGHFRAAAIAGSDIIEDYIDARLEEGAQRGGIRIELAHIKTAYRLAARKKQGFAIPYIPTLKGRVRETRYTEAQYQALLRQANPILRVVLEIAYWTGWRKTSILKLPWTQVDLKARFVWLEMPNTKNEKGTRCYLHDELLTLFEQLRADTDRVQKEQGMIIPWVIHRKGKPVKSIR